MDFIDWFIANNDNFPTIRTIAKKFNVYPNAVQQNIKALVKKGDIERINSKQHFYKRSKAYLDSL